jgi:tetratricopeptide (TPR) repeat protein
MKTEHRKELETNTLQETLQKAVQTVKQGPSRNTTLILVLIGLGVVLYFSWRYFASSARQGDSARWWQWASLTTEKQAEEFTNNQETKGTTQNLLARFTLARVQLRNGMRDLDARPTLAVSAVQQATELYEGLIEEAGKAQFVILQQEALLNAGKGREALGDLDQAREHYERLIAGSVSPESVAVKEANQRLAQLKKDRADIDALANKYKKPATNSEGG